MLLAQINQLNQIDVKTVDEFTKIAARDGMAVLVSVTFLLAFIPIVSINFNRIGKRLQKIENNTKGFVTDDALKDILKICVSDIRNKMQSFIYNKIEKNHIFENYSYIENEIPNEGFLQINEKREALIHVTTYNNISQFKSVIEKNLSWHIKKIKESFVEELKNEKINYNELKNATNKELTLFEQETINQFNKLF